MSGRSHWDGTSTMPWVLDDGGRSAAGFRGAAGDCVARSVAIASRLPYSEIYARLAAGNGAQRGRRGKRSASARNGVQTSRKWFRDYMASLGFEWTPTMLIGQGCKVHLLAGELPTGRLVVALSKHLTAVVDGVIRDTFDPSRTSVVNDERGYRLSHRCVYGYWKAA